MNRGIFRGRARAVSQPDPAPVVGGGGSVVVDLAKEEARLSARVEAIRALSLGRNSAVDLSNYLASAGGTFVGQAVTVLSFVVPVSMVLIVERIAVAFSDPVFDNGGWLGWRPAINGGAVPYVGRQDQGWILGGYGSMSRPLEVSGIVCSAHQTFSIQVVNLDTFDDFVYIGARFGGRLVDTSDAEA